VQSIVILLAFEAHDEREQDCRGSSGEIMQHDQDLARRQIQQPCHFVGFQVIVADYSVKSAARRPFGDQDCGCISAA
jgi:hypothetical protein